jgi:hypothetical protein
MGFFLYLLFLPIGLLISVGFYVVSSISLYTLAQRRYIQHPYLAWIPFAREYLFAEIIGSELKVGDKTILYFPWVYVGALYGSGIITGIVALIPFLGPLLAFLCGIFISVGVVYVNYRFYKLFEGGNEVLFTIFSYIVPVTGPFFLLYLRNHPFVQDNNYTNYAV